MLGLREITQRAGPPRHTSCCRNQRELYSIVGRSRAHKDASYDRGSAPKPSIVQVLLMIPRKWKVALKHVKTLQRILALPANDDVHKLTKTTKDYYVLKNTPKNPKVVEFAYFEMWIHRKSFVVVKTDYYDRQNKKYRTYEALQVKQIQDKPTVTKAKMTDLRTNGNTILEYSNIKYDVGIPESIFTERYLRKPARKYLK